MKIAQFKTDASGWTSVADENTGESCSKYSGWVRVSEYVEVEFVPLPPATVVEARLKQIDAAEQELREKFQQKINELTEARAKFLPLSHEVTP